MSPGLIERDRHRIDFDDVAQKLAITHLREAQLLFLRRQAGHEIDGAGLDAPDILFGARRYRVAGNDRRVRLFPYDELVRAKGLAIEEHRVAQPHPAVELRLLDLSRQ